MNIIRLQFSFSDNFHFLFFYSLPFNFYYSFYPSQVNNRLRCRRAWAWPRPPGFSRPYCSHSFFTPSATPSLTHWRSDDEIARAMTSLGVDDVCCL